MQHYFISTLKITNGTF